MQTITTLLQYFFEPIPAGQYKFMYLFIALAVIGLAASIALRIYLKKHKEDKILRKLFRTFPGKLQTVSICLGLYILVRYEKMPFLSMRFLNYIIIGTAIYLLINAFQLYSQVYPHEKKRHEQQIKANKYVPRKGHKKH